MLAPNEARDRKVYTVLFYLLTVMHFMSGFGFLFKVPYFYHPDAYIINGKIGDGTTEFENLVRIPFGLCYVAPFIGVIYAHWSGSKSARRAAIIGPIIFHCVCAYAAKYIFSDALNPEVAPIGKAVGLHLFTGILCGGLFKHATDDIDLKKKK